MCIWYYSLMDYEDLCSNIIYIADITVTQYNVFKHVKSCNETGYNPDPIDVHKNAKKILRITRATSLFLLTQNYLYILFDMR